MKHLKLLLLGILQYLFIFVLLYAYNRLIGVKSTKLPINLSFYYYIIAILPITIIIWNSIVLYIKNIRIKYCLLCIPSLMIVSYWIDSIGSYPYRILFMIVISITTLLVGNVVINRYIQRNIIRIFKIILPVSSSMPKSVWGGVRRLGDVNNQYVGGIKDSGGVYMYARQAWSYKYNVYTWNNKRYDSLFKQLKKNR